jgi:glycosyltransferase involved in cell wall biosynthesis
VYKDFSIGFSRQGRLSEMKFSLILATLNRTTELSHFLSQLARQNYPSYELIVVDQNKDDRLNPILSEYNQQFPILHLRSEKGVSRARNAGILQAQGDILGFPDDDCWYPENLLHTVEKKFRNHPSASGFSGRILSKNNQEFSRFPKQAMPISRFNASQSSPTAAYFLQKNIADEIGGFDQSLGPGAGSPWEAGEDTDYILRALERGYRLFYDPDIIVYHPVKTVYPPERAFKYGSGIGHVWRKHNFPAWLVGYYLIRPLGGILISLIKRDPAKVSFYWQSFKGRWSGWRSKIL